MLFKIFGHVCFLVKSKLETKFKLLDRFFGVESNVSYRATKKLKKRTLKLIFSSENRTVKKNKVLFLSEQKVIL